MHDCMKYLIFMILEKVGMYGWRPLIGFKVMGVFEWSSLYADDDGL